MPPAAMLPAAIARTHVPNAAQVTPSTHLLCRVLAVAKADDEDDTPLLRRGIEIAERLTQGGGIITELHRSGRDLDGTLTIVALVSVTQAVGLIAADASDQARETSTPPLILGAIDEERIGGWIRETEEDARRRGVERLSRLLASCGVAGDTDVRADQLWTECGY